MSTLDRPLDELYLEWLYSHVASARQRNRSKSYWSLARQLFSTEFVWFVPNDDNRAEDGRDLRHEFVDEYQIEVMDQEWMSLGCSMLEMLIALSRRLAFEATGRPSFWFWQLIENIGMTEYTDRVYTELIAKDVSEKLERVIWRTYTRRGHGGLFPLDRGRKDQRDEEIWYQLSAYLLEQEAKGG